MSRYPTYQIPDFSEAEARMRPSGDFLHGFMGDDPRRLTEILNEDAAAVQRLGLSHEAIAEGLENLSQKARAAQGEPVSLKDGWSVRAEAHRGKLPCPFGHPGIFPKIRYALSHAETKKLFSWSDLSLHLIKAHGFYQGKGSPFRLSPEDLAEISGLF